MSNFTLLSSIFSQILDFIFLASINVILTFLIGTLGLHLGFTGPGSTFFANVGKPGAPGGPGALGMPSPGGRGGPLGIFDPCV